MNRLLALVGLCMVIALHAHAGTWGTGSFDNDGALDWASDLSKANAITPIAAVFDAAMRVHYIEAPHGEKVVVAAEAIAAALGKPNSKLPPRLEAWVKKQPKEEFARLVPQAQAALARVLDPKVSELRQLWAEGKPNKWPEVVAELKSRLGK